MWKDITIRTHQKLYPVLTRKTSTLLDELEQQIEILSILDGRPIEYYDGLTKKQFNLLLSHYEWVYEPPVAGKHPSSFKVKGVKYWVDYNPANIQSRLTGRDIIDLTTIANQDGVIVANMNRILSAYCKPSKRFGLFKRDVDMEEALLDLDMQTALDITAFFLPLLEACSPVIQDYLNQELAKQKEIVSTLIGDGTLPSTT